MPLINANSRKVENRLGASAGHEALRETFGILSASYAISHKIIYSFNYYCVIIALKIKSEIIIDKKQNYRESRKLVMKKIQ
jgi:hypothetical protein